MICCEVADKNQYNKLLGIVKITVEEFGTDHTHTVKYLILRMSECQVVYRSEPVGPGLLNRDSHKVPYIPVQGCPRRMRQLDTYWDGEHSWQSTDRNNEKNEIPPR